MSIQLHQLRGLAGRKGMKVERHFWRERVRILCRNDAVIRHYPEGFSLGLSAFGYRHAWRYLRELPDAD